MELEYFDGCRVRSCVMCGCLYLDDRIPGVLGGDATHIRWHREQDLRILYLEDQLDTHVDPYRGGHD